VSHDHHNAPLIYRYSMTVWIKMMGYIETLDKLGCELKDDLATDVILQSLPVSYEPFIMNFHMNGMEKTVAELHGMLKTV
jgi:hypothetical protein